MAGGGDHQQCLSGIDASLNVRLLPTGGVSHRCAPLGAGNRARSRQFGQDRSAGRFAARAGFHQHGRFARHHARRRDGARSSHGADAAQRRLPARARRDAADHRAGVCAGRQGLGGAPLHRRSSQPGIHGAGRYPAGAAGAAVGRAAGACATGWRSVRRSELFRSEQPEFAARHDVLGDGSAARPRLFQAGACRRAAKRACGTRCCSAWRSRRSVRSWMSP